MLNVGIISIGTEWPRKVYKSDHVTNISIEDSSVPFIDIILKSFLYIIYSLLLDFVFAQLFNFQFQQYISF